VPIISCPDIDVARPPSLLWLVRRRIHAPPLLTRPSCLLSQEANAPRRSKKRLIHAATTRTWRPLLLSPLLAQIRGVEPHPHLHLPHPSPPSSLTLTPARRFSHEPVQSVRAGCHAALQCKSMRWQSVTPIVLLTVPSTRPAEPSLQTAEPPNRRAADP
jgi:hypothetical protein